MAIRNITEIDIIRGGKNNCSRGGENMSAIRPLRSHRRCGAALVLAMIFMVILSALAVAMATTSGVNVELASGQRNIDGALLAAQSGLECSRYLVKTATLLETSSNTISAAEANTAWTKLVQHVQTQKLDNKTVPAAARFADAQGAGDEIVTPELDFGPATAKFKVRLFRYDSDPKTIKGQGIGTAGNAARKIVMDMPLAKGADVLKYAIAGRGRMWLTGDTTIHGNLFSTWNKPGISPFNMTSDSKVLGTISTVRTLSQIESDTYQLETLNGDGLPVDAAGNPITDNFEDRYYGPIDQIQGYHQGIIYSQPYNDMPGLNINDYNTDTYKSSLTTLATTSTYVNEYFPHAAGNYTQNREDGAGTLFKRYKYENQTFSNIIVPQNKHCLFKNCTFQDVLYIDCSKTSTSKSYSNNVRFENCTFNGVTVTNTPNSLNWVNNCLYFTGTATFNNQSAIQEATILAPHFNVNLGNTNPEASDNNVLTGAIVGGIVDIRGNAQIYGTIISMCDTNQWPSGYVTNIGATLNDGGSETTEVGDIGVISITPEEDTMLPSGVTSPVIIKPNPQTYAECI